jgi:hypothetical protein
VIASLFAASLILPGLIYYALFFSFLAATFSLCAILQLITWAGRAWRDEPIFDK